MKSREELHRHRDKLVVEIERIGKFTLATDNPTKIALFATTMSNVMLTSMLAELEYMNDHGNN